MCKTCIESFIKFTIPKAIQNPVMQKVCPNGLHSLVHLARDVLCILLICLVLNVPVNNVTVMLGQGHRFLGITSTFGESICHAKRHNIVTRVRSDTRTLASESDALTTSPAPPPSPLSSLFSLTCISITLCKWSLKICLKMRNYINIF